LENIKILKNNKQKSTIMKKINTIHKGAVLCFLIISSSNFIFSQFNWTTALGNDFGRTNIAPGPNITAIGIGNFTTSPLSALHVNTNLLPASTVFTRGELFRTTGPANQTNAWRMETDDEKFRLYVPAGSNSIFLNASNASGSMRFQTGGSTRMFIREANGSNPGFVGIGLNYISPASLLHINGTQNATGMLFGTSGLDSDDNMWRMFTGASPGNGTERFRIMVPNLTSNVHLNAVNQMGSMHLQTGGVTRLFIQQGLTTTNFGVNTRGFVGIGTQNPASPLHIVGNQQLNAIGGWQRAITISQGSIAFVNSDNSGPAFFMAYQST
jgi:hypothetical protein